jgi:holliday junction DNA helicase RuvA
VIAWLRGRLQDRRPPFLIIDVAGVGYQLEAPMTTFYELPRVGEEVTLHTHHLVREDAHHLYGFARVGERDVFRLLLKVNGVGAKLGLAILSGMDAQAFARCVQAGDTASLTRLPGVGRKTAERLVVEMRDRLDRPTVGPGPRAPAIGGAASAPSPADPVEEAVSALVALGLKPPEASRRVHAVEAPDLACEELVRRALQSMVR